MCGIHAVISTTAPAPLPPTVRETLSSRGPDHFGQHAARLRAPSQLVGEGETAAGEPGGLFLTFTSTVLALRGDRVTAQPFVHPETGSVLCWNGEAWKMDGSVVPGNDGELVFRRLSEASARVQATPQTGEMEDAAASAILGVLRSIQGPFAFVYLDAAAQTVYYGRDRLGRRSLLIRRDVAHGGTAAVSSVTMASAADTCDSSWVEVEADGVYVIRLRAESSHGFAPATRLEWSDKNEEDLVSSLARRLPLMSSLA
ncbi:hypothetical protein VTK73DRAFT_1708 [Phialemonium thermophilum]|uniref:Glutamine amidotransferase type-2 domain-containing protein n=1 Tax=Phialemonium thermophilum TaxID=223376 RepID=A0ABR3VT45_9PEZI